MDTELYEYEEKTFPFEVKKLTDEGTFEGYAAIFGTPDVYNEIIEPGAFNETLQKEGKTRPILWYHDPRNPLGLAELDVDKKGLHVIGQLNLEVQLAKEKHSLMKQNVIRGLSFGFKTMLDLWKESVRILKKVRLYEISPCTFQMHPKAVIAAVKSLKPESLGIALKALEGHIQIIEEFKAGKKISSADLKLINNAAQALKSFLKAADLQKGTSDGEKGLFSPIIEALEREPQGADSLHLFGSTIKALEIQSKE